MDASGISRPDGLTKVPSSESCQALANEASCSVNSYPDKSNGGFKALRFPNYCGCQRSFLYERGSKECEHCSRKPATTQELSLEKLNNLQDTQSYYDDSYQWTEDNVPVYRSVTMRESMYQFSPVERASELKKVTEHLSYTKRPANTLFWKFSRYPVSLKHGFSSCNLSHLYARIEEALNSLEIDYKFDEATLLYICERTEHCVCNGFTVIVSKLQKSCQDELGHLYVIELCLLGGDTCPAVWNRITSKFFEATKDVISCPNKKNINENDEDKLKEKVTSDREKAKVVGNEVLTNFIDLLYSASLCETTVRMAEVFAELTSPNKAEYSEKWLRPKDIDKLIALIERGDRNLSRCVCTVIRNVAQAGILQFIPEQSLESLLKSLLRLLNTVDSSDVFLLELQREALRALIAISELHKPTGFLRAMGATVVKRCATSSDDRLSGYAGQALNLYVQ